MHAQFDTRVLSLSLFMLTGVTQGLCGASLSERAGALREGPVGMRLEPRVLCVY
jgi:hypothetical protein